MGGREHFPHRLHESVPDHNGYIRPGVAVQFGEVRACSCEERLKVGCDAPICPVREHTEILQGQFTRSIADMELEHSTSRVGPG